MYAPSKLKYRFASAESANAFGAVYALCDSRTNTIRYVGKTGSFVQARVEAHFQPSSLKFKCKKNSWLKELFDAGGVVIVDVLEQHTDKQSLDEAERFYISYFRYIGMQLTNHTDGGDGNSKGCIFSPEARLNMSAAHKGPRGPRSPETRVAVSKGKGGRAVIDSNGVRYATAAEAARSVGVRPQDMNAVLLGRMHSAANRRFRYEDKEFVEIRQKNRPIIDDIGEVYPTMRDAAASVGACISSVSMCLNGKRKSVKGRVFRWAI